MARLGYPLYLAQGGDWGSLIAHHTAVLDPQSCRGLHVNLLVPAPPKDLADPMSLVREHEKSCRRARRSTARKARVTFRFSARAARLCPMRSRIRQSAGARG